MRAIDADALQPKLKALVEAENQIYGRASWNFSAKCCQVIEDAPPIKEEPQWIPCSKGLPKKDGDYYVTTSNGQIARYIFIKGVSEEYWMRCAMAWMPLPAPYRSEGDDKHEQN